MSKVNRHFQCLFCFWTVWPRSWLKIKLASSSPHSTLKWLPTMCTLADFLHFFSILVSFLNFAMLTFYQDYDRIESGILFDSSKNCLWSYIEEAVQISNVTQEPTCPNLVNQTYAPNNGLITVSGTWSKTGKLSIII